MTHTSHRGSHALHIMVSIAFLTGTMSLLSVANGLFAMMSGGGTVVYPDVQPSLGGPAFSQTPLYAAAPVSVPEPMAIERITLGILLILLGYALHAVVTQRDERVAVHGKRRTGKSRRSK